MAKMQFPTLPPVLEKGDQIPQAMLTDAMGRQVSLYDQQIAGDVILLAVIRSTDDPEAQKLLSTLKPIAADLAKKGVRCFTLTLADPKAAVPHAGGALPPLGDGKGQLAPAFGIDAPAPFNRGKALVAILRPNLKVEAVIPHDAPDLAKAVGEAVRSAGEYVTDPRPGASAEGHAPVLIVPDILPPDFCDYLIDYWHKGEKHKNTVSSDRSDKGYSDGIKQRADVGILDDELGRSIQACFIRRLVPELRKAFHFEITEAEVYRIGCYDSGDDNYFRRHRDTGTQVTSHRRYAVSLNLNSDEYEGGEITFPEYGTRRYTAPKGGAVVFSCGLLHEALPVTEGRRFALFTFLKGRGV